MRCHGAVPLPALEKEPREGEGEGGESKRVICVYFVISYSTNIVYVIIVFLFYNK
jgi:hypothetical protein